MKRIEQYSVRHYEGEWIAARGFCIEGAGELESYVSLGDSEMLRAVRRLSGRGGVALERAGVCWRGCECGDAVGWGLSEVGEWWVFA